MKITALALAGMRGWPDLDLSTLSPGLNVVCGPVGSGKTTLAEFLAHALFGRVPSEESALKETPEGEAIVENSSGRYRLRHYHDGTNVGRLTVASLSGEPVDRDTVQRLLGGLSPNLMARVFATGFAAPPQVDRLMAAEFSREFQAIVGGREPGRKTHDLAARRDALAEELETRIANERRASGELEQKRRELERQIREGERAAAALELRLRSVETALAETDARLRYRRLELNTELRWHVSDATESEPQLAELDQEIARWRATMADLARREANVRTQLAQLQTGDAAGVSLGEQRAWMAVAHELAADLEGEVARLARASASQQCVCRDAHPRLRPMVETLSRQLNRLDAMVEAQQRSLNADNWAEEAEHLSRSQAELRGQLDHLLDRRQTLVDAAGSSRRRMAADELNGAAWSETFSAADAEQLEQRRLELEQERFALVEKIRREQRQLRDWRTERADIDRERAALLSVRSIEHVQRELAAVQRKLEHAAAGATPVVETAGWGDEPWRASDYLAQLTDGRLVRLELGDGGRRAWAVRKTGEAVPLEALTLAERDQVYLSFVLALVSAVERHGVRLPVVLDDPFVRLDERGTAALAAVLADFARQGHQLLVFTGQKPVAERLGSLGARVHDLVGLRRWKRTEELPSPEAAARWSDVLAEAPEPSEPDATSPPTIRKVRKLNGRARKIVDGGPKRSARKRGDAA